MILLLLFIILLLIVSNILFIRLALVGARKLKNYDQFYEDTIEDVAQTINMFESLMQRQFMSDDTDVQNLYRIMQISHDILLGYLNADNRRTTGKEERKN